MTLQVRNPDNVHVSQTAIVMRKVLFSSKDTFVIYFIVITERIKEIDNRTGKTFEYKINMYHFIYTYKIKRVYLYILSLIRDYRDSSVSS